MESDLGDLQTEPPLFVWIETTVNLETTVKSITD